MPRGSIRASMTGRRCRCRTRPNRRSSSGRRRRETPRRPAGRRIRPPISEPRRGQTKPAGRCRTRPGANGAMSLIVKICGLKTPDALDAALAAGADMVGFVFFPPSPRHLGFDAARALGARVKGRAKKVALSVDANAADLGQFIAALKPDMLQLHGRQT